ncbi:MAG: hypothetical protein ACE147_13690, partial [Candidatus Methylomirabilales bacterium]
MQTHRTKLLILAALLGVWALIFGLRMPAGPSGGSPPPAGAPRAAAREAPLPRLKLELLEAPRPPYPSEVHNIFG